MPVDLGERKGSRKAHKKSRNGCAECKKRKIKCDERKPRCSNCIRYEIRCSFVTNPTASSSSGSVCAAPPGSENSRLMAPSPSPASSSILSSNTPRSIPDSAQPAASGEDCHPALNIRDLELLHNYDTLTSYTLTNIPNLQIFSRINVPQFAFSHPFLLHGILALSALHLSHFRLGESHTLYLTQANYHYEVALRTATSLLPDINQETSPSLFYFASICCIFALGVGPRPGDFLLFGEQGIAEWLVLFRGMKSILEANHEILRNSILSPMFEIAIQHLDQPREKDEHLLELQQLISDTTSSDPNRPTYLSAIETLVDFYPASSVSGVRATQSSPQVVFACLYRFPDEFVTCLQQRDQIALVIFAHFCVMLHDLSSFWWMKGWAEHLISEVYTSLNGIYRAWIRWPLEEIGWIPA